MSSHFLCLALNSSRVSHAMRSFSSKVLFTGSLLIFRTAVFIFSSVNRRMVSSCVPRSKSTKSTKTVYTSSASPSCTVNTNSVYSPCLRTTTPLVSSSSSRRAVLRGANISRLLDPPVTKIQSLKRRSRTVRKRGGSSANDTGIAIALYFFITLYRCFRALLTSVELIFLLDFHGLLHGLLRHLRFHRWRRGWGWRSRLRHRHVHEAGGHVLELIDVLLRAIQLSEHVNAHRQAH